MSDRLQGKAKIVEEFAEGVYEGQRQKASVS